MTPEPTTPDGLSDDARDLFLDVVEAHGDALTPERFHALTQACRLVTLADRAEAAIGDAFMVDGYKGQPVPNGLLSEVRLSRAAAVAALKAAGLSAPAGSSSAAASALASKRWRVAR